MKIQLTSLILKAIQNLAYFEIKTLPQQIFFPLNWNVS